MVNFLFCPNFTLFSIINGTKFELKLEIESDLFPNLNQVVNITQIPPQGITRRLF